MSGRRWTAAEDAIMQGYKLETVASLLKKLPGRNAVGVKLRAMRLGLCRKYERWSPEREAQIRALHAEGWSDRQIGKKIGMPHSQVARWRSYLLLPVNGWDTPVMRALLKTTNGVKAANAQRKLNVIKKAEELGYPGRHITEAWILSFLEVSPRTTQELIANLGLSPKSRAYVQRHLIKLCRDGLIMPVERRPGKTSPLKVWGLCVMPE